jgi:uncharacterized protein (TIGR00661 family)
MNILYGVPSEGMGHATRSKVLIDFLLSENHNVQIVSSDKAFTMLNKSFPNRVHEIKGFHFAFKGTRVSKMDTFMLNLKAGPRNFLHNFSQFMQLEKKFVPNLVITDFESFAYYYAKLHNIPIISIDNIQAVDRFKLAIPIPADIKPNFNLAKNIVKAKVPSCNHYFVSSFFAAECRKKNTSIVPPIVRQQIIAAKTSINNHILVYQSTGSSESIKDIFKDLPHENFMVYGFNKNEKEGNVTLKTFSEDGFINDLATCKAVIANGGYSFISEAIYMHKPIFSFPLKGQFEQFLNAAYIEQCGYGRHFTSISTDNLKAFLYDLNSFQKNLQHYKQDGNKELFRTVQEYLKAF